MNKESEQQTINDQGKPYLTTDFGRHSTQSMSFLRSLSHGSSGAGNSSHHSFTVSFRRPTGLNIPENTTGEPESLPEASSQQPQEVPLRRLAYLNKPEIPVIVISATIDGSIFPVFGILISSIIKTFYDPPSKLRKDSQFWALMFVVLGGVSLVAAPARTYFFSVAGCRLIKRIRSMCFEKVVHMEVGWFDDPAHSSGAIGARLSADAATVRRLVGDALALLVQNTATAIAGLAIAFQASWQLALIILVLLPLVGISGWAEMKFMEGFSADAKVHT
uniref:ABC transmembrane type-1 domain-containing protein n=1 Tax=Nelumbo nucifera TaxID=4432 RepID=A0A822YKB2_NELNU|nr:TPA_asm: hypothetical protein HUJ06_011803 [Nelumbo nucifera]